ncbi:MAG: hypothetical protein AAFV62_10600, partial [Pseudomonadota bacterium]
RCRPCTYNASRSPMAAAICAALYPGKHAIRSVGVFSGIPVEPYAVAAAEEIGLDLSDHHPQSFTDLETWGDDIGAYDLIVTLSPAAHSHALEFTRFTDVAVVYWPTVDPTAEEGGEDARREAFRATRDSLYARIKTELRNGFRAADTDGAL